MTIRLQQQLYRAGATPCFRHGTPKRLESLPFRHAGQGLVCGNSRARLSGEFACLAAASLVN